MTHRRIWGIWFVTGVVAALSAMLACTHASDAEKPLATDSATQHSAGIVVAPTLADSQPKDLAGVHNVVAYGDRLYSGSVPEGDSGFDSVAGMGVKTIISVDGAAPDVELARKHGMRYIHLPIGYNGFDDARRLQLTRATADALKDGPVFIHCHHGKHRSAGAAGAVAVSLGFMPPAQAVDRMKVSGTAPNYKGLYECALGATPVSADALDEVPADFPPLELPKGLVKGMVEVDEMNDHLKEIEKAGWKVPSDHPDLVPVDQAARIVAVLDTLALTDASLAKPVAFAQAMKASRDRADELRKMLAEGADAATLTGQFKKLSASCKDCHAKFRD